MNNSVSSDVSLSSLQPEPKRLPAGGSKRSLYILTIIISCLLLFSGHLLVMRNFPALPENRANLIKAEIEKIISIKESPSGLNAEKPNLRINFSATLNSGEHQGNKVIGYQSIDFNNPANSTAQVKAGDRVLLYEPHKSGESLTNLSNYVFVEYDRSGKLLLLLGIFCAAILLFGKVKGFNTLLSLILTILMILLVFIPGIIAGYNIYLMTLLVCLYATLSSYLLVIGYNAKAYAAVSGCLAGVIAAGFLAVICNYWLKISGITGDEAITLGNLPLPHKLDLQALVFSMVLIGALGAVMDVAMDISSALAQVKAQAPNLTLPELYKIGIEIGQDLISTLSNTLIMAYIGTALLTILVLSASGMPWNFFFNREHFAVEVINGIIGTFAILLTIPLTSFISACFYGQKTNKKHRR